MIYVFYGATALKEEHRLRVFENRVLRGIFGTKRDGVIGEICGVLGYYTASCDNCFPTFRDNVSVPSSRVKSTFPTRTLDP
jgi:hypothetical protein